MDAFTAGILQRIKATESDLSRARETGDEFLVEIEQDELDDLHRLAAEHGVELGVARLTQYGRAPAPGRSRQAPGPFLVPFPCFLRARQAAVRQSCQAPSSSRRLWSRSKSPGGAAIVSSPDGTSPGRPPVSAPASLAMRSPAARSQGFRPRS